MKPMLPLVTLLMLPAFLVALAPSSTAAGLCRDTYDRYSGGTVEESRTCVVTVNEGGYTACVGYVWSKTDHPDGSGQNDTESRRCEHGI